MDCEGQTGMDCEWFCLLLSWSSSFPFSSVFNKLLLVFLVAEHCECPHSPASPVASQDVLIFSGAVLVVVKEGYWYSPKTSQTNTCIGWFE